MIPLHSPEEIGWVFETQEKKKERKELSKTGFRKKHSENFVLRIRDSDDV